MSEIRIPDFLKYVPEKKECRLTKLTREYEEKFGKTWATAGLYLKEGQLEEIFEQCLAENRTFYDVIGIDMTDYDEDDDL